MNIEESNILTSVKCLFSLKEYIYSYYNISDITHIFDNVGDVKINFDEHDNMKKIGEESLNVISAILVDSLLNKKIDVVRNDIGNIPSKSDIKLSNGEYLEMKRVPIGTKVYNKNKKSKYSNFVPITMSVEDTFGFIKDKVDEYSPLNLKNKQKADYIGFYFAVSNLDLHNSSIMNLYNRVYSELKPTLNVFKDVFLIFNRLNLYDTKSEEKVGETVCLSLKTGNFNSLTFKTPFIREQRIKGNVGENYEEKDIISDKREKNIILYISTLKGTFYLMDGIQKYVCYYNDVKAICYGNYNSFASVSGLFDGNIQNTEIHILTNKMFKLGDETMILPFIVRKKSLESE